VRLKEEKTFEPLARNLFVILSGAKDLVFTHSHEILRSLSLQITGNEVLCESLFLAISMLLDMVALKLATT